MIYLLIPMLVFLVVLVVAMGILLGKITRLERDLRYRGLDKPHVVIAGTGEDSVMKGMHIYTTNRDGAPLIHMEPGGKVIGNILNMGGEP